MDAICYRLVPQERAVLEPYQASVRSELGEAAWEEALARGRTMGLDEAIGYALSQEEQPSAPLSPAAPHPAIPSSSSTTSEHPGGLTSREIEVLTLVAEGLTNAQVAKELFLSPRTIQRHLSSIYHKIGVSSRAAATRFALEHHLL
jgi:DNA-binding NarL/FixJ family response regulator